MAKEFGDNVEVIDPEEVLLGGPGTRGRSGATSTLISRGGPRCRISPLQRRGPRLSARYWSFLPWRRNHRRRRNLNRKINYTDEGELPVPRETNKKKTGLRWRRKDPRKFKFVDDDMICSKISIDSEDRKEVSGGRKGGEG